MAASAGARNIRSGTGDRILSQAIKELFALEIRRLACVSIVRMADLEQSHSCTRLRLGDTTRRQIDSGSRVGQRYNRRRCERECFAGKTR